MTASPSCPDRASLELLLEKGGAPEEIDRLAAHLETCAGCGNTIESLLAADQTAALLRGAKVEAMESSVKGLCTRLAKLRSVAGAVAARDNIISGRASRSRRSLTLLSRKRRPTPSCSPRRGMPMRSAASVNIAF